ncbi:hypothetical protein MES4922_100111 [Mesorhizobium ventifaucium]|uniref:DUF58 domain-containing protein n=1 Tax=Mesorhizobium ventifaucium TaxID=666020 RepID=A0ABN8JBT0_9HYPH|nr:hypothetical protein MES4922_100111 [Mesorhizobium ventifaucium]
MHVLAIVVGGILLVVLFPRAMGLIVLIVVGLIVWAIASVVQSNNRSEKILARMGIELAYDVVQCSPDHPIHIVLSNNSSATVTELTLEIIARRQGHSDIVVRQDVRDDKVIGPQTRYGTCWSVTGLDSGVGVVNGIPVTELNWSYRDARIGF